MNKKNQIIVLDGAKGAGKSTTSKSLKNELQDFAFLSMDSMRHFISNSTTNDRYNNLAFDSIIALSKFYISKNISVVIDSGLKVERLDVLNTVSKEVDAEVVLFYLSCPKEELWNRVKARDKVRDKTSNRERFDYVHGVQQNKNFDGFIEINTLDNDPEEVLREIISHLND